MSSTSRRAGGPDTRLEAGVVWAGLALVVIVVGSLSVAVHVGAGLERSAQRLPSNPFTLVLGLARGTVRWPSSASWVLGGVLAAGVALAVMAAVLVLRARAGLAG